MPRIKPLVVDKQIEYEIEKATNQLIVDLRRKTINRKELLKLSGISNSALSQQLTRGKITIQVYLSWQILKKGEVHNAQHS